ncbi:MAG: hypothetical protein M3434_11670, partial [Gemmatimonadota bacterium]|nr:hypothetical protein [Gemmatimonadota bacterium]
PASTSQSDPTTGLPRPEWPASGGRGITVVRSVARATGPQALERHWPGSPEGLAVVRRLARV